MILFVLNLKKISTTNGKIWRCSRSLFKNYYIRTINQLKFKINRESIKILLI